MKSSDDTPLNYAHRWWMRLFLGVFFVLLYAPIVTLMIYSFNDSKRNIVWRGFTTKYYAKAWNNESLIEAFVNSLTIATANMILGHPAGRSDRGAALAFSAFPSRRRTTAFSPCPSSSRKFAWGSRCWSSSTSWWPNGLPWPASLGNVILAHVTFTFPFVAIIVRGQLGLLNRELEQAAMDPGRQRMARPPPTYCCRS